MEASFYETARQLCVKSSKSVGLDCCIRWNATYTMLSTALEYRAAFMRFQLRETKFTCCPTNDECDYVETLTKCLKHFLDATEILSGTLYPTANLFFVEFCEIQLLLNEWSRSIDDVIVFMSLTMNQKFKKYWKICNKIVVVVTFLDPRYKMRAISYYFLEIYGDVDGKKYVDDLLNVIKVVYASYVPKDGKMGTQGESSRMVHDSRSVGKKRKSRYDEYIESTDTEPTKTGLDFYIEEKTMRCNEDNSKFDVLTWWKANVGKYPTFAKMARDILGIPISTVVSDKRSSLDPSTVEALICSQDWIKVEKGVLKVLTFYTYATDETGISSTRDVLANDNIGSYAEDDLESVHMVDDFLA